MLRFDVSRLFWLHKCDFRVSPRRLSKDFKGDPIQINAVSLKAIDYAEAGMMVIAMITAKMQIALTP